MDWAGSGRLAPNVGLVSPGPLALTTRAPGSAIAPRQGRGWPQPGGQEATPPWDARGGLLGALRLEGGSDAEDQGGRVGVPGQQADRGDRSLPRPQGRPRQ